MSVKTVSPLLAVLLLVACDSAATGATAQDAAVAQSTTKAQETPDSPTSENAGAAMATNSGERVLRDSYYECAESNDGATWDMQACVEAEFEYQDARLNTAYRNVMTKLADPQKAGLKNEERKWISDRDSTCSWDAQAEGQAQRIEANICALKMTAERAAALEKMLSE